MNHSLARFDVAPFDARTGFCSAICEAKLVRKNLRLVCSNVQPETKNLGFDTQTSRTGGETGTQETASATSKLARRACIGSNENYHY